MEVFSGTACDEGIVHTLLAILLWSFIFSLESASHSSVFEDFLRRSQSSSFPVLRQCPVFGAPLLVLAAGLDSELVLSFGYRKSISALRALHSISRMILQ